ncbi:MAG: radical SAM family heme chaperone HemW [bacterium]
MNLAYSRSLYLHIPFCRKKCNYCDFVSYANKENIIESYINAVLSEVTSMARQELYSLFIGGGTPSVLEANSFKRLFEVIHHQFHFSTDAEITLETNPESLTKNKLQLFRDLGINRLSIGLQATDDIHLKFLGRIHSYNQFKTAYDKAREIGFNNINIDVMFGIPGLSMDEWKKSLQEIVSLHPDHLSLYALSIEEGTRFYSEQMVSDDDSAGDQYEYAVGFLKENGFNRYEISNFAYASKYSKHNSIYWDGGEYYGVGAGAAGYIDRKRTKNDPDVESYIAKITAGKSPVVEEEVIDQAKQTKEKIFLGLRKSKGVVCGEQENEIVQNRLLPFLDEGLLIYAPPVLRLSDKGMLLANQIWRALL